MKKYISVLALITFLLSSCQKIGGSINNDTEENKTCTVSFYEVEFAVAAISWSDKRFDKDIEFPKGYELSAREAEDYPSPHYVPKGCAYVINWFYLDEYKQNKVDFPFTITEDCCLYYHCAG